MKLATKTWILLGVLVVVIIGVFAVVQNQGGADADSLTTTTGAKYNQYTADACAKGQLSKTFCENNGYAWNSPSPMPSLPTADQAYQNCLAGNPSHPELCDSLNPNPTATPSASPTVVATATPTAKPTATATPTTKPTATPTATPSTSTTLNPYTEDACANGQLSQQFCEDNGYTWNSPSPNVSLPTADEAYQNCLSGNPNNPEFCDGLAPQEKEENLSFFDWVVNFLFGWL